jgi:hypothetical protein
VVDLHRQKLPRHPPLLLRRLLPRRSLAP